jgi:hypothetical protein
MEIAKKADADRFVRVFHEWWDIQKGEEKIFFQSLLFKLFNKKIFQFNNI